MKTKTFTSTISPAILSWVDSEARNQNKTRREIFERALLNYKQDRMREGFLRAAIDPDIVELAEWGMPEYDADSKNI